MKKCFLSIMAIASLVACNRELEPESIPVDSRFSVECADYDNAADPATKSANFTEDGQKVTDLNIWVYEHGGTGSAVNAASGYSTYFTTANDIDGDLLFPDMDKTYDIYLFTNVGQVTAPATNALAAAYKYQFTSYDTFQSKGFPMAAHYCFNPSDPTQSHSLKVKRLVSKYNVKFNFEEATGYDFELQAAYVCQSASAIVPFAEESAAASQSEVFRTADELSVADLQNEGGELYMLENMQGECFSEGAVRSEKNILPGKIYTTTYLAFEGRLDKHDGTGYNKVTCRYYFGNGVECAVKRNLITDLNLNMTNSVEDHDNWVVTPEDPYNNGFLLFDPPIVSMSQLTGTNTCVVTPYVDDEQNDEVGYTLSWNSTEWTKHGITLKIAQHDDTSRNRWKPYTGTVLHGVYDLQFVTSDISSTKYRVNLEAQIAKGTQVEKDFTLPIDVKEQNRTQVNFSFMTQENTSDYNCGYSASISNYDGTVTLFSAGTFYGPSSSVQRWATSYASEYMKKNETYRIQITRIYGSTHIDVRNYSGQSLSKIDASATFYLTGEQLGITSDNEQQNNSIWLNLIGYTGTAPVQKFMQVSPQRITIGKGFVEPSSYFTVTPPDAGTTYRVSCSSPDIVIYRDNTTTEYSGTSLNGTRKFYFKYTGDANTTATFTVVPTGTSAATVIGTSATIDMFGSPLYDISTDVVTWKSSSGYASRHWNRCMYLYVTSTDLPLELWDNSGHHYTITLDASDPIKEYDYTFNDDKVTVSAVKMGYWWSDPKAWYYRLFFDKRCDYPGGRFKIGGIEADLNPSQYPVNPPADVNAWRDAFDTSLWWGTKFGIDWYE